MTLSIPSALKKFPDASLQRAYPKSTPEVRQQLIAGQSQLIKSSLKTYAIGATLGSLFFTTFSLIRDFLHPQHDDLIENFDLPKEQKPSLANTILATSIIGSVLGVLTAALIQFPVRLKQWNDSYTRVGLPTPGLQQYKKLLGLFS